MTLTIGLFRIGADAELRYTTDGMAVCNVSLAYKHGKPDQSGNQQTGWITAAIWGERAENSYKHLTKGKEIEAYVSDVHIETYTNAKGAPASKLAGTMIRFEFTSGSPRRDAPETEVKHEQPPPKAAGKKKKADATSDGDTPL